jgi:hypothetical protein
MGYTQVTVVVMVMIPGYLVAMTMLLLGPYAGNGFI